MKKILILGAGSAGSNIVDLLTKYNGENYEITICDFDTVEQKNLRNQQYQQQHVGMKKVDALKEMYPNITTSYKDPETVISYDIVINAIDELDNRKKIVDMVKRIPKTIYYETGINLQGGRIVGSIEQSEKFHQELKKAPQIETSACGGEIVSKSACILVCSLLVNALENNVHIENAIIDTLNGVYIVKEVKDGVFTW